MQFNDLLLETKRVLVRSTARAFRHPIHHFVPLRTAGLYSIWDGAELLYLGVGGEKESFDTLEDTARQRAAVGLVSRLATHRSGQRTKSTFCQYFCDRFIVPGLTDDERRQLEAGERTMLDEQTRQVIRRELSYRFADVRDGEYALEIEAELLNNGLFGRFPVLQG